MDATGARRCGGVCSLAPGDAAMTVPNVPGHEDVIGTFAAGCGPDARGTGDPIGARWTGEHVARANLLVRRSAMNHAGEPTPASASSAGPSPAPSVEAFDEREAATLLAADELRVRTLLTQLESGGVISHTGADEHLVPVEDRTFDGGAELAERELQLGLLESLERELAAIDNARSRLHEGRYGRCSSCGVRIGHERLRAVPAADRCIEHA